MKKRKFFVLLLVSMLMVSIMAFAVPYISATPQHRIVLPFHTSWEDGQPLGRVNSVYAKKDFYGYYGTDNPPPELGRRNSGDMGVGTAPNNAFYKFGSSYLMAAGYFGSSNSYCYFNLFDMTTDSDFAPPIKIRPHIFIQIFYRHHNLAHSMIDAQLYNKRTQQYWTLRDFNYNGKYIVDQNGVRIHPGYRYNDPVGSWQNASFDLSIIYEHDPGNWYITKIWIGFDNRFDPKHPTGQVRTYFDMLHITYAVVDKKTTTWEDESPDGRVWYYNVWTTGAIEAWAHALPPQGPCLWLKVAVSGFSDGYYTDAWGWTSYRYPYKLRVSTTASAVALPDPQPTGVNLTQVDENVGPSKAEMFVFSLATVFVGRIYAPAGYILTAWKLAKEFAGLLKEPEEEKTYEWPKAVIWEEEFATARPPNVIQGEVYILVSNLNEGLNSIPITFEVDTYLAYLDEKIAWRPYAGITESFTFNFEWNTNPDYVNLPPETPSRPSGPTSGYAYMGYTYSTSTTDPNGDDVGYEFDWGDGSTTWMGLWTGLYASGQTVNASHFWKSSGTYHVKVRARDSTDAWSGWSSYLTVNIIDHPPQPQPPPAQEHRYVVMGGITTSCSYLNGSWNRKWMWTCPFATRPPDLTPMLMSRNIKFSAPDPVTGVVYLTVPAETYVGLDHVSWDSVSGAYFKFRLLMPEDGYGWLFTGTGTNPILGDVDYYTFTNYTGVYWTSPSPKAGQLATSCGFPSFGPDGIAGTGDDGFGNGNPNPPGSSILYLPTVLDVDYFNGTTWTDFYEAPWPQVLTTATAYNIVTEPSSSINGVHSTMVGKPWEFLAGIQGNPPYKGPVPWNHTYSNAYVTYVCAWSVLRYDVDPDPTVCKYLDVHFKVKESLVREDCVIADADCNQVVNILDILIASVASGQNDEGFGRPSADPKFDARADMASPRGLINILDILKISVDYGKMITPNGIIRP